MMYLFDPFRVSKRAAGLVLPLLLGLLAGVFAAGAAAMVEPGRAAPGFRLQNLDGDTVQLEQWKGRWVILEWTNPDCPFVQKHYNSGNMQALQQFAAARQVVWVQINSTNPAHPEFRSPSVMRTWNQSARAVPAQAVLDPQGIVGRAYGARTTPQMVLINPAGVIVYHGAIDSIRSANTADVPKATPLLRQALEEGLAGKPVTTPSTTPYGCSVKYA